MEHPVLAAIRQAAFTPLGWFQPSANDGVTPGTRFVILIGNAGPAMYERFARERDPDCDALDDWTRDAVTRLGRDVSADALFPFDRPYPPILTWARKAGAGFISPLGLNIHGTYGLWHAFRAALLFPVEIGLPLHESGPHPCESCADKPCLSACPVEAFSPGSYDTMSCAGHIASSAGKTCMETGCLARHACPVGQDFAYAPAQAQFHMKAFLKARG